MATGSAGSIALSCLTRSQPVMSSRSTSTTARPRRCRRARRNASSPRAAGYALNRAWRRKPATRLAAASSPSATTIQRAEIDSRELTAVGESRFSARGRAGFEIEKLQSTNDEHSVRALSELTGRDGQDGLGEAERARSLLLVIPKAREGPSDQIALGLIERRNRLVDRHHRSVGPRGELREIRPLDLVTRSESVGPLEEVLQLAHVTGEVVRGQRRDRIGGDALDVTPETLVEPPEEIRDQRRNVTLALAEGRDHDAHDVEPVKEVLAEAPVLHHRLEVLVGRGDHPHADGVGLGRPDGPDLLVLDDAEQLALERRRQLGHLVEEEGAAVRGAKEPEGVGDGAREGSPHVAEELRLHEVGGDRAAVDRHEGALGPPGLPVDRRGHQVLAGPALALDQHR